MRKCKKCGIEIYNSLGLCPSCFAVPPMPETVCIKPCGLCGERVANEEETICSRCKEFWMTMLNRVCNTCEHGGYSVECVGCKHNPLYRDKYKPVGGE